MNIRLKQVGLLLALFIVGSCSNDMIETSNNSSLIEESYDEIDLNSLKSEFSFALARVLNESEGVRKLIKEEAIKQFDYDYDVLYMLVKDKKLRGGGTLEEFLSKYMSKENLLALYKEMPTLTVFVPVLPNDIFSAEKWNVAQEVPFVAYKSKENQILFVDNAGKVNTIKSNEIPSFPIVVVKPSERVILRSASTRNFKEANVVRAENGLNFVFEYEEFNNLTKVKTRVSPLDIPTQLQKVFDAKKFADQNGIWQRDYVYYNIMTKDGKGVFQKKISECVYFLELTGIPDVVYHNISDQGDDPHHYDKQPQSTRDHPVPRGPEGYWYNGNYEFLVKTYVSNKNLVSDEIIKAISIPPYDLFELDLQAQGNRMPYLVKGVKSIKRYYLPEPLPLFDWNIEDYSTSIKISIIEKDLQTTTQNVVETTTTFATNFDFDLGLEEKVKVGAKFGTSTTVQHRVSTTVTTYLDSDELQDVIVNFGDDIIIKNEMDSVGFTYCGRRGEYRCPIYEPALNPKYNSGYYKLGIIPLAQY